MGKRRMQLQTYEVVPATVQLPMLPKLGNDDLKAGPLGELRAHDWFSRTTTLGEAESKRQEAVERCVQACVRGDASKIGELLELSTEFGHDPRFADANSYSILARRLGAKRTGRPPGRARADLERSLRIARIVEGLRSAGVTLEEILRAMDEQNFERVPATTRRNDYYRARNHAAMQPLLFTREDQRRTVRRRAAADSGYVLVPQQLRIELPHALPARTRVSVSVTRHENTVTFACQIG